MYSLQLSTQTLLPKSLKFSPASSPEHFIELEVSHKVKPIPIIHKKIQQIGKDDWKIRPKITSKGYKYISHVAATGESTIEILNRFKKCSNLKLIKTLEFDPYFCEESGLRPLSEVFRKLRRNISSLTLIIRRFGKEDNLEEFCASLARLKNLVKLRLEPTSIVGLDLKQVKLMTRAFTKCSLLKSLDLNIIEVPIDYKKDLSLTRNLPWLEHLGQYFYSSQTWDHRLTKSEHCKTVRKLKRFKGWKLRISSKKSWASYSDGTQAQPGGPSAFTKLMTETMNPVYLSFIFESFQMSAIFLTGFAEALPQVTNLRFLHIELANTGISEFDLMLFANCFLKSKQIQQLTFKYIDKSTISAMDTLQFIMIMAQYNKIPKFDLFFRTILYEEWSSSEIKSQLQNLENIKYIMTKQSIHIQKCKSLKIEREEGGCDWNFDTMA